jgi:rhodanese-related sulfurtransferase
MRIDEGDPIEIDGVALSALYTPGHTDDSYCFVTADRVFTGDTLLIRGTGRTDFQSGDPYAAYESLFGKLLTLPDNMRVYPGHDYKGDTVSTIGEERAHNPRLQVASAEDYAAIMNGLHLPDPKMMDVAVPANLSIGMPQTSPEIAAFSLDPLEARARLGSPTVLFVDLREDGERRRDGIIPGSVHVPYPRLEDAFRARTPFSVLAPPTGGSVIFYCAFGERSALALEEALGLGLDNVWHLSGGFDAWLKEGAPSEAVSD